MLGDAAEGSSPGLVLLQMAPWLGAPVDRDAAEAVYHHLNATIRSVFLLRISAGSVSLLDKPGFKLRGTFNDSREPEPEGLLIYREEFIRAQMYRGFFQRCLAGSQFAADLLIAIDVNDAPITTAEAPVFAFQKPMGSNIVLIPDPDFLHANFYIAPDTHDALPYAEKSPRAVFAGSTTGGRTITAEDVRSLALPRLRAGMYFKGRDQVDFRLPRIVQCETAAVAELVAALGIDNRHCSWDEQFRHRFILSMDGNGATCSRVVIGLLSGAALVKYDSPQLLYYFGALLPWRHFIPVATDGDVVSVVEAERRHPMIFAPVAAAGREFAQRHLGRHGVCTYVTELLRLYESCLTSRATARPGRRAARRAGALQAANALTPLVDLGAHVQGVGDVWGWPGEWVGEAGSGRAIEAIALVPTGLPREAFNCQVVLADGSFADVNDAGYFYGTRGEDKPLHGFTLELRGNWAHTLDCAYSGRFTDGETIGPLSPGQMCRSTSGAPLEAFDIVIRKAVYD